MKGLIYLSYENYSTVTDPNLPNSLTEECTLNHIKGFHYMVIL